MVPGGVPGGPAAALPSTGAVLGVERTRPADDFGLGFHPGLTIDRLEVIADRVLADEELLGDIRHPVAEDQVIQHFLFPR